MASNWQLGLASVLHDLVSKKIKLFVSTTEVKITDFKT